MGMNNKPETISIDDVKYIRADTSQPAKHAGMDYCIVRSRDQGVMCGYVESINGRTVKLHQARQIWRYDSTFVLVDVAEHGMRNASKAQMSVAASQPVYMLEACGVLTCTKAAADQLIGIAAQSK
jgi:prophage tail gpP-like protein